MDRANHGVKDASLVQTIALPSGASAVVITGFDLGLLSARGGRFEDCEVLVNAPVLAVGELANADTMTYSVEMDTDSAFSDATVINAGLLVQTGADGTGAAAASARFKIPSNCERYLRVRATNSAANDASGKDLTVSIVF